MRLPHTTGAWTQRLRIAPRLYGTEAQGAVGAAARLAAVCLAAAVLSGCATGGRPSPAPAATRVTAVAASCAALRERQRFRAARVVFDGTMLSGLTVHAGTYRMLRSPARVRVIRWLKGRGPSVAPVVTAAAARRGGLVVAEDGIQPLAGQTWRIYSDSRRPPFTTSACAGSRLLRPR